MKKWIIGLMGFLFIVLISLPYIVIPGSLVVSNIIKVNLKSTSAFRTLLNENDWHKWWPGDETKRHNPLLTYGGFTYHITDHFYNAIAIRAQKGDIKRESRINIIPINRDSVLLVWEYPVHFSLNPFIRVKEYGESDAAKKAMNNIMLNLKTFLNNPANIYGMNIHVEMSSDSTLISTKFETGTYPSTSEIYRAIGLLKTYIQYNQATESNYPMLHVEKNSSSHYETMVAIPVNKALPGKGKFEFKHFVPWKVLTAEIKGGDSTINQAYKQFKMYIQDYSLLQMANSFESLVTDRSKEKDTSKWITRFYTPIP